MQQAVDRHIHRIAGAAGDHGRTGGSRQVAPASLARRVLFDMADRANRVGDRPIAGAAAEVALQSARQIAKLRLVERGCGHDHACGTEPALEALRVKKGLLHGVEGSVGVSEPFDRCHSAPLGAERRDEAAMHRLAVEMNGAGAAVAGVATLLHAEPAEFTQERAKALAGPRRRLMTLAVDEKAHGRPPPSSTRISSANSNVMWRRQSGRPWMSS